MPRRFCLIFIALLWLHAAHAAETRQRVHVGYYEFPPYSYTDAQGQPSGSGLELTARLLDEAGYQADFRSYPGARLYGGLLDGSIQLWAGASGKPELAGHTLESRHLLGEITLNLYFRLDTPAPIIPDELQGRGVIMITGYSYWQDVNQWLEDPARNIIHHRTRSHTSALEMLQRRRADYLLDYRAPVEQAMRTLGMDELPFVEVQRLPLRLIYSRHAPGAERLRDDLDKVYQRLQESGENLWLY
ncbi:MULTISPECIES: substrate-binding periplasmic protein [Pseudomonas]|uniref:substrate-binding periplasmic protein n=1 Tax=Pseudomonas TaxID=286 RepID=UPI000CC02E59|nr:MULTISPECIES: transporter substrate-binding domain-containing protein [Pseudomonas]MDG9758920.1 transporter substrate-binding domain-containing protein [Pseudomonas sediminis]MPT19210.1 transporter substrate-binding domain-containing protein [Pseudomonas sp.]PKQ41757.1 bifunctional lytic transglycosylase/amino acid ABC transporter substrate-binding protein [Pseudomonas sp. YY-1]TRO23678.1 transporter substrate-binding domain-containing protein [Pseudomonas mendocina]TRO28155.1 transporter s